MAKVSLLLAALMLGLRIIFSIMVFSRLNIGADKLLIVMSGLKFDGILSGSVATAILLPYVLIHSFSRKAANAIAYTAIALYTLIAFIETEYFITMARPLDHVLLVYPTNEVFDILTSSTSITMPTIINLMLCIGLTCVLIITSKKMKTNTPTSIVALCAFLFLAFNYRYNKMVRRETGYDSHSNFYLAVNHPSYTYIKINDFLKSSRQCTSNPDIALATSVYQSLFPQFTFTDAGYPFWHTTNYNDVLGPVLKKTSNGELPNLVFVIIEGFGQKLTGIDSATVSFTPFLDSLANNGLYWKNCLSTAERTFGALPAIFASAPHGEGGFASKWHPIPDHNSLLNDLVQNGYTTSFFYGGSASFDGQDAFLIRNGINYILDTQPDTNDIAQTTKLKNNHRWGLDDSQMIDLAIAHKQTESTIPFADIYLTLTTHEPFEFPGIDQYIQKIAHWDENATDIERQNIDGNLNIFATFNYADDCIRKLFEYYKSRPDYQNTIFIIVGDHRMCPLLAPNNPLMKYHIPLILYSPLLVTNKSMNSVVSHLDITPTINAYLSKNYHYTTSPQCHWLGTTLDTSNTFLCKKDLAFMLNNRDVIDFLSDTMMISGNRLFHVNSDLSVIPTENNAVLDSLTTLLNSYQTISKYVIKNDYLKKNIEGAKESLVNLNLDFDHNVPSEFKKQLYNKNGNMCMLIDSTIEYGTLCSKIDLQKKCKKIKVVIMFDFQSSDTSKKLPKIVIEAGNYYLASPIDSALNTGLSEKYQLTTTIDIEDKDNATMKIYLWNPNHSRMTYDNLMIKIDILN